MPGPKHRRPRGHIRELPSGSYQVIVYAGTDPLTKKPRYLRETLKAYDAAEIALTWLQGQVDQSRQPKTDITLGQRLRRVPARQRMVSAVAGFRGAVSLAAILAVPHTLDSGAPFPGRDLIVLITCGVILLTLLQALVLPSVVRFARLPADTSVDEEVRYADGYTLDAAIEALETTASELGSDEMVIERVRRELDKQRRLVAAAGAQDDPAVQHDDQYASLLLALIARRREALLELRDVQRIDDIVLRRVQARLDIDEVRLLGAHPLE